MAEPTAEILAQRVVDLNLLDQRQLNTVWGDVGGAHASVDDFIQAILRREYMTNFQMERLLRGEKYGYFYGDYKVLYLVAGGSFARVYRAVHKDTGQIVALKVLRRRYSDDRAQYEHFVREGELGKTLRHPNIVPIYEVHSSRLTHFLVMEFVEGSNLREFLKARKKLEPLEATDLAMQIVSGLRYAAGRGCQHRDLKLTNVLVSSRRQAKLIDFGLAATELDLGEDDLANQRTIDYAGLERATGVRRDDPRSDIFFMGAIYYHMLTGKAPLHETRDRIQRLARSRYAEVTPIQKIDPTLPQPVVHVVNKSMEFEPERRYQTLSEMLLDLEIAMKRLEHGVDHPDAAATLSQKERDRLAAQLIPDSQRRAVMLIEANTKLQDIVRAALKKDGYRVLVISDAERALARFEDAKPADCVIFGNSTLGENSFEAFSTFAQNESTRDIPAILLWDKKRFPNLGEAETHLADHRVAVPMPFKLRDLREVLMRLAPAIERDSESVSGNATP